MTGEKPDKWTCKRCFAHACPRTHETTGAQDGVSERHRVAPWREGWTRSFPFVCPSGLAAPGGAVTDLRRTACW